MSFQHFRIQIKAFTDLRRTATHRFHHLHHTQPDHLWIVFPSPSVSGLVFLHLITHAPLLKKDIPSSNLQQRQGPPQIFCLIVKLYLIMNYLLFFYLAPIKIFLLTRPAPLTWRFSGVLTQPFTVSRKWKSAKCGRKWKGKDGRGLGTPGWKPIMHSGKLQMHPAPICLIFFSFSSSLWFFIFTPHLDFSPHQLG